MTNTHPSSRLFRIGSTLIPESASTQALTVEQVRQRLKVAYPEIAHAGVRETREGDTLIIDFVAQAGRKG